MCQVLSPFIRLQSPKGPLFTRNNILCFLPTAHICLRMPKESRIYSCAFCQLTHIPVTLGNFFFSLLAWLSPSHLQSSVLIPTPLWGWGVNTCVNTLFTLKTPGGKFHLIGKDSKNQFPSSSVRRVQTWDPGFHTVMPYVWDMDGEISHHKEASRAWDLCLARAGGAEVTSLTSSFCVVWVLFLENSIKGLLLQPFQIILGTIWYSFTNPRLFTLSSVASKEAWSIHSLTPHIYRVLLSSKLW